MTTWIDVTTLLRWVRPPVGVVRTNLEIVRHALQSQGDGPFDLCRYDREHGRWLRLLAQEKQKIADLLAEKFDAIAGAPAVTVTPFVMVEPVKRSGSFGWIKRPPERHLFSVDPVEQGRIRGWVLDLQAVSQPATIEIYQGRTKLVSIIANQFRPDLEQAGLGEGHCAFSLPIRDLLTKARPNRSLRFDMFIGGERRQKIGKIKFRREFDLDLYLSGDDADDLDVPFRAGDICLMSGADWDDKDLNNIYEIKKKIGIRIHAFCYDLIPVKYPHYFVGIVDAAIFSKYFVNICWCADKIFCISQKSQADLLEFIAAAGCPAPETVVIRLGIFQAALSKESARPQVIQDLAGQDFILFVSTIERRKNHDILYRAYVRLVDEGVRDLPRLVFVGMPGWGVENLISDLALDPRIKDRVLFLHHVNDGELQWLYTQCLFAVFPSLYEGWGLPVAEALAHGKLCLCSNAGSLPEVAGDLVPHLDPWDLQAWKTQIFELSRDKARLATMESRIRAQFIPNTWSECCAVILSHSR